MGMVICDTIDEVVLGTQTKTTVFDAMSSSPDGGVIFPTAKILPKSTNLYTLLQKFQASHITCRFYSLGSYSVYDPTMNGFVYDKTPLGDSVIVNGTLMVMGENLILIGHCSKSNHDEIGIWLGFDIDEGGIYWYNLINGTSNQASTLSARTGSIYVPKAKDKLGNQGSSNSSEPV